MTFWVEPQWMVPGGLIVDWERGRDAARVVRPVSEWYVSVRRTQG